MGRPKGYKLSPEARAKIAEKVRASYQAPDQRLVQCPCCLALFNGRTHEIVEPSQIRKKPQPKN